MISLPRRPVVDGILNLDKPEGSTSMEVVRLVKRLTRVKRVGHAGTLDPIATGVLPICLGQATRLTEQLVDGSKIYRAEITLGVTTDTYDADGTSVGTCDPSAVTRAQVESLLPLFIGSILQRPPMFSAVKHRGRRLYELARAGVEVERPAREVRVERLSLLSWLPPRMTLEAECGRGFYMRALAHDLGIALGCGAHLSALVRVKAGPLTIDQTVRLEDFESAVRDATWEDLLEPSDLAVVGLAPLYLSGAAERQLRNGRPVVCQLTNNTISHMEARRAYGDDGRFLGIVRFDRALSHWRPEKLFSLPLRSPYAPG